MKNRRPSLNRIFIGIDSPKTRNRLICKANKEFGYSASEISRELKIHRSTVGRILSQSGSEDTSSKSTIVDSPITTEIVEQALNQLKTVGRENLSLRRLASDLKMSPTNLYNYFQNKNDLLDGIRIYGFRLLLKQIKKSVSTSDSAKEKLKCVVDVYFDFGTSHGDLYDVMFNRREVREKRQTSSNLQEVITLIDELNHYVRELVEELLVSIKPPSTDQLRETVLKLWSQLHGLVSLYIGGNLIYMSKLTQKDFWSIRDHMVENFVMVDSNS